MNPLDLIMDVAEAAELWSMKPGSVKNMCARGEIQARKVGRDWIIRKDQENPVKRPGRTDAVRLAESAEEPPLLPDEELEYFIDLYVNMRDWDALEEPEALERLTRVFRSYHYDEHAAGRLANQVRKKVDDLGYLSAENETEGNE